MENKNWFVRIEWIVVHIILLGCFYALDSKVERLTQAQSNRTDKLYEMFIDLVKEGKNK